MKIAGFSRLSSRDGRAVMAGGAIILALLLASRGIPAWLAWQDDARASAAELLTEAALIESTLEGFSRTLDSLEARKLRLLELAPMLLSGEDPHAAGAQLAGALTEAAAASRVRLGSVHVEADSTSEGVLTRVGARTEATGDIRGITAFLEILEGGPTLISLRELSIRASDVAAPPDRPEELQVRIAVEALALLRRDEAEQ